MAGIGHHGAVTGSQPPHQRQPRPAVYRSGGEHRSPGLYGDRRRRVDPLLLVGVSVLILGLLVGGVLALQALSGTPPKVDAVLTDETPSSVALTSAAPSVPASSAARPSSAAPSSAAASRDPSAPQQLGAIRGSASGLCVDLAPGQPGPAGPGAIVPCGAAPTQRWLLNAAGALINVGNGQCLGVAGGAPTDGAPIVLEPCAQTPSQQWRFAPSPDGRIAFQVVHSGKCLDALGESTAPGTPLQQFTCNGRGNQSWLTG